MSHPRTNRSERLMVRFTPEQRMELEDAAASVRQAAGVYSYSGYPKQRYSLAAFVRNSALHHARQVLKEAAAAATAALALEQKSSQSAGERAASDRGQPKRGRS